jgi:hypothetical protein
MLIGFQHIVVVFQGILMYWYFKNLKVILHIKIKKNIFLFMHCCYLMFVIV